MCRSCCGRWRGVPGSPRRSSPVRQDRSRCLLEASPPSMAAGARFLVEHLFLQAPGAAATTSGAPGRRAQTRPIPPSPAWETRASRSGCGVVAHPLLGCCWVWHGGWLSPWQGAFPALGGRGTGNPAQTPLSKDWAKPELQRGRSTGRGLRKVPVSVPLPASHRRSLFQAWTGAGSSAGVLRAEHAWPLVPLLLPRKLLKQLLR